MGPQIKETTPPPSPPTKSSTHLHYAANATDATHPPARDLNAVWKELQSLRDLVLSNISNPSQSPQPPQPHKSHHQLNDIHEFVRAEISRNNDHITQHMLRPEIERALLERQQNQHQKQQISDSGPTVGTQASWSWSSPSHLIPLPVSTLPPSSRKDAITHVQQQKQHQQNHRDRPHPKNEKRDGDSGEEVQNLLAQLTQNLRKAGRNRNRQQQQQQQLHVPDFAPVRLRTMGTRSGGMARKANPSYTRPTISFLSKSKVE